MRDVENLLKKTIVEPGRTASEAVQQQVNRLVLLHVLGMGCAHNLEQSTGRELEKIKRESIYIIKVLLNLFCRKAG
jgi:hypothetical protein